MGGEIDLVKPSPRDSVMNNMKNAKIAEKASLMNSTLTKNGINLTEAQLAAILNAIQSSDVKKGNCF